MCTYIYIYICVHMYLCIYMYVYSLEKETHTQIYIYIYTHTYMCVYLYRPYVLDRFRVHTRSSVSLCMHVSMHLCMGHAPGQIKVSAELRRGIVRAQGLVFRFSALVIFISGFGVWGFCVRRLYGGQGLW